MGFSCIGIGREWIGDKVRGWYEALDILPVCNEPATVETIDNQLYGRVAPFQLACLFPDLQANRGGLNPFPEGL